MYYHSYKLVYVKYFDKSGKDDKTLIDMCKEYIKLVNLNSYIIIKRDENDDYQNDDYQNEDENKEEDENEKFKGGKDENKMNENYQNEVNEKFKGGENYQNENYQNEVNEVNENVNYQNEDYQIEDIHNELIKPTPCIHTIIIKPYYILLIIIIVLLVCIINLISKINVTQIPIKKVNIQKHLPMKRHKHHEKHKPKFIFIKNKNMFNDDYNIDLKQI